MFRFDLYPNITPISEIDNFQFSHVSNIHLTGNALTEGHHTQDIANLGRVQQYSHLVFPALLILH